MARRAESPFQFRSLRLPIVAVAACACQGPASPSGTGPNIDGVYTLKLETTCSAVPEGQRVRTYRATITGSPEATVTLSGATFWQHPTDGLQNVFTIRVTGRSMAFRFATPLGVVEQFDGTSFFQVRGDGTAVIGQPRIARTIVELSGGITGRVAVGTDLLDSSRHVSCSAGTGQASLTFTRSEGQAPPPGVAHSIKDIDITGPDSVAPNTSERFAVVATLTDGSARELERDATWRGTNTAVMSVTADGLVTGRRGGEDTLSVTVLRPNLGPLSRTREVVIVPAGTYRVVGKVTESGFASIGVPDVKVTVTSGPTAGMSTVTDPAGLFRLYGVALGAEIEFARIGYVPRVHRVTTAAHHSVELPMSRDHSIRDLRGIYQLRVSVEGACQAFRPLAANLRERTYDASLAQNGPELIVTLSGADFATSAGTRNQFRGTVDARGATFTLGEGRLAYFSYGRFLEVPDVVERLADGTVLVVSGRAVTTLTGSDLVGTLGGSMSQIQADFPANSFYLGWCDSPIHRFALVRGGQ